MFHPMFWIVGFVSWHARDRTNAIPNALPRQHLSEKMPALYDDLPSFTKELSRIDALSKDVVGLSFYPDHATGDFGP